MNKWIITILILVMPVLGQTTLAEPTGYSITKDIWMVPVCYDVTLVSVSGENKITDGDYILTQCYKYEENKWRCPCINDGENRTITIIANKSNVYDFRIQYYVDKLLPLSNGSISELDEDNSKRIENINNVKIVVPTKPFNIEDYKWILIGIFGVIIFIFVDVVILIKWLGRDDSSITKPKKEKINKKEEELDDEEVLKYLKDL